MLPTEETTLNTLQTARLPDVRLPCADYALGTSQGKDTGTCQETGRFFPHDEDGWGLGGGY
jgi:hypothetical protein